MWMTLLEIGKFCFGENYKGSSLTDFNSNIELNVSAQELQSAINHYDEDEHSLVMARKAKILKRILDKAQIEDRTRVKKPNSVNFLDSLV
jgi:predicted ATPase